MSITVRIDRKHAFVLRPATIKGVWEILEKHIGPVYAEIGCSDSVERKFTSLEDLLVYENSITRAIISLTLYSFSEDRTSRAGVTFNARNFSTISAFATGSEEHLLAIRNGLEEIFDGARAWFATIARLDFFYVLLALFIFSVLVIQSMVGTPEKSKPLEFEKALFVATTFIAFIGAFVFLGWGLNKLRKKFFPLGSFVLGQGEGRFQFEENIRWMVIIGFVISTLASLVVAILLRHA